MWWVRVQCRVLEELGASAARQCVVEGSLVMMSKQGGPIHQIHSPRLGETHCRWVGTMR